MSLSSRSDQTQSCMIFFTSQRCVRTFWACDWLHCVLGGNSSHDSSCSLGIAQLYCVRFEVPALRWITVDYGGLRLYGEQLWYPQSTSVSSKSHSPSGIVVSILVPVVGWRDQKACPPALQGSNVHPWHVSTLCFTPHNVVPNSLSQTSAEQSRPTPR